MRVIAALLITGAVAPRLASQDKGCQETKYPAQLPAPSAVVDSAHAIADLAMFAGPKPMVFSLVFNKGDSVPRIHPLDKNDAAAGQALYSYVKHQPAADLWAIRVKIAGGDAPSLTLERSQYCPPEPTAGEGRIMSITGQVAGPGSRTLMRTGPDVSLGHGKDVLYEALIGADGHVLLVRVLTNSDNGESNADVVQMVQRQHFKPATLDDDPLTALFRSGGESPRP
jgi:hypothetical protein